MIGDFPLKSKLLLRSKLFVRLRRILVQIGKKEIHIGECSKKYSWGYSKIRACCVVNLDPLPQGKFNSNGLLFGSGIYFSCTHPLGQALALIGSAYDCMYSIDQYPHLIPNMPQTSKMFVPTCRQSVPINNFWIYCRTTRNSLSSNSYHLPLTCLQV